MAKELILENESVALWYHPESKIVHHQIKKYIFGKNLQEFLLKGSELLKVRGASKWLSDDRNNNALGKEDAEWANNTWLPLTVKSGWKYWAIVQPEKIVGQLNMKSFAGAFSELGITAMMFSDPDEAMKWLAERK